MESLIVVGGGPKLQPNSIVKGVALGPELHLGNFCVERRSWKLRSRKSEARRCRNGGIRAAAPEGGELGRTGKVEDAIGGMKKLLSSKEKELAKKAAHDLVSSLSQEGRAALLAAFYQTGVEEDSEAHFKEADTNLDGIIDQWEFATYAEAQANKYGNSTKSLTRHQLQYLFVKAAIGMVGFGFIDNAIMIIAGDAIEHTIGAALGLSTLLSAGLGNAVADLTGTAFSGYIERMTGKLMPQPVPISSQQMQKKEAWWADTVGASFGVTVGCILGLTPLFILKGKHDAQKLSDSVESKFATISGSRSMSSMMSQSQMGSDVSFAVSDPLSRVEGLTRLTSTTQPNVVVAPPRMRSFCSTWFGAPFLVSIFITLTFQRAAHYLKRNRRS